jgi:hypothetical protein
MAVAAMAIAPPWLPPAITTRDASTSGSSRVTSTARTASVNSRR